MEAHLMASQELRFQNRLFKYPLNCTLLLSTTSLGHKRPGIAQSAGRHSTRAPLSAQHTQ